MVQKDDIGTIFEMTLKDQGVVVDISTQTTLQLLFRKPDKITLLTKAATFTTDGTDGKLQYISIANDIDEAGTWRWQARVVLAGGQDWKSSIAQFEVKDNLP